MSTVTITAAPSAFHDPARTEPSPPRYSSLPGCISESAAEQLRNITNSSSNSAPYTANSDLEFTQRRPPCYSSVFRERASRGPSGATGARRRGGNLSVSVGVPVTGRRGSADSMSEAEDSGLTSSSLGFRAPLKFEYNVKSGYAAGRTTPWATLKVFSRTSASPGPGAPHGADKLPRYGSTDLVQGCLELDLESPQSINSISLVMKGRLVTSSFEGGVYTFYEHSIVNWTRADGDPRTVFSSPDAVTAPSPLPSSSSSSRSSFSSPSTSRPATPSGSVRSKKYDGKLFGSYLWPFSFAFPSEISIPGLGSEGLTYPAPPTFNEKGSNTSVQYEFILKMTHGVLKADSKLYAPIAYTPDITPSAPSVLRQLAYNQQLRIPGPTTDPFGWTTLPPAIIRGRFAGAATGTKLQCSLSLANPCSYTRGTVIPLHLTIRSTDAHILSELGKPECLNVQLVRKVRYLDDPAQSISHAKRSGKQPSFLLEGGKQEVTVIEKAVWWSSSGCVKGSGDIDSRTMKTLDGEIHLERDLQPSCNFLLFDVSYEIEIVGIEHPSFRSSSKTPSVLLSHPVTITTRHADGPRPISVTPSPSQLRRQQRERSAPNRPRGSEGDAFRSLGNLQMFMGIN